MNKKIIFILVLLFTIFMIMGSVSAGIFDFFGGGDDTVRIGYIPSDHDAALFVANSRGDFDREGLTVDLKKFNNGNELMDALENGDVDVGYISIASALSSIGNGKHSKIISAVQNEGSGLVMGESSTITQPQELRGKSIAIPGQGSVQELLLLHYLKNQGLSLKDLNITYTQATSMNDDLKNSKIDGAMVFQPYATILESNGNVISANSSEIFPNHPCCVMVASDDFIESHSDTVKKVVGIHKNATSYINHNIKNGNTSHIVDLLPQELVQDKNLEVNSLESYQFTSGLNEDFKANVFIFQQLSTERGSMKGPLSNENIFWEA